MMMIPRKRNEFDLFDDMFMDSFFDRNESRIMKTDIKEKGDKEIEMENGYLKVIAKTSKNVDESNEEEKYIHKERFYGECSRSFYVGDNIKEEDIKAGFKNGILSLVFPKEQQKQLEERKRIQID